jgi:hypothetical protein
MFTHISVIVISNSQILQNSAYPLLCVKYSKYSFLSISVYHFLKYWSWLPKLILWLTEELWLPVGKSWLEYELILWYHLRKLFNKLSLLNEWEEPIRVGWYSVAGRRLTCLPFGFLVVSVELTVYFDHLAFSSQAVLLKFLLFV